jgi:hypothetical protein
MMYRQDKEGRIIIIITTGLMDELTPLIGDIGGLKSVAELLGWEYDESFSIRIGKKVTSYSVIKIDLEDFLKYLSPEIIEENESETDQKQIK